MYNFKNDYCEGAHPAVLKKLSETNMVQQNGYGEDDYSQRARKLIGEKIANPEAQVYFSSGGTQANLMVITHLLKVHEAAISAKTGHIFAHETGAIEANGHRIITIDSANGKLYPEQIREVLSNHSLRPHVVKPKLVYISNSSELGSIYTKVELKNLWEFCQQNQLYLFMDGARLGHALTAQANDLTLQDVARWTDVFYIGGTKNGALLGEAIIFKSQSLGADFDYVMKQKGALLAKGRILGLQFLTLFEEDLYFSLASHANKMAQKIASGIRNKGFDFLIDSPTNQIFPILKKKTINILKEKYFFYIWEDIDTDRAAVRIITSWATPESMVDAFIDDFNLALQLE